MEKMKLTVLIIAVLSTHCVSEPVEERSVEGPLMIVDNAISTREIDLTVTPTSKKRDVSSEFDESVDILLDVEGEMVTKRFTRSPEYDDITMYDGDEKVEVKRNWAMYSASEGEGAIMVTRDAKNRITTEGSIIHNDQYFFIQPTKDLRRHVLHRITPKRDVLEPAPTPRIVRNKRARTKYVVELALVVDRIAIQKSRQIDATLKRRPTTSNEFLEKHLALVMADVNVRYGSLSKYGTDIEVRPFLILWSDGYPYTIRIPHTKVVNSGILLRSFGAWARDQKYTHDSVMLLTGLVFSRSDALGSAQLNGACKDRLKYSVVKFGMGLQLAASIAHELGHNLGIDHDQKYQGCQNGGNYVMSESDTVSNDRVSGSNSWKFTWCSNNYLVKTITRNSQRKTCLTTENVVGASFRTTGQRSGYLTTYDQVCSSLKRGSKFCVDSQWKHHVNTICTRILCSHGNACKSFVPYDGTPCGNYKICKSGKCEQASNGKPMDELCPYGNKPNFMYMGKKYTSCSRNILQYCNDASINEVCCETCQPVSELCADSTGNILKFPGMSRQPCSYLINRPNWCIGNVIIRCCQTCKIIQAGCTDKNRAFHQDGTTYTVRYGRGSVSSCTCNKGRQTCEEGCLDRKRQFHSDGESFTLQKWANGQNLCLCYKGKVTCQVVCKSKTMALHRPGENYLVESNGLISQCSCDTSRETCKAGCLDRNRDFHRDGTTYTVTSRYGRRRTSKCSCNNGRETCENGRELCADSTGNILIVGGMSRQPCSYLMNRPTGCSGDTMRLCCQTCKIIQAGCLDRYRNFHRDGTTYTVTSRSGSRRTSQCSCKNGRETCKNGRGSCTDHEGDFLRVRIGGRTRKESCSYLRRAQNYCKKTYKTICCATCRLINSKNRKRSR